MLTVSARSTARRATVRWRRPPRRRSPGLKRHAHVSQHLDHLRNRALNFRRRRRPIRFVVREHLVPERLALRVEAHTWRASTRSTPVPPAPRAPPKYKTLMSSPFESSSGFRDSATRSATGKSRTCRPRARRGAAPGRAGRAASARRRRLQVKGRRVMAKAARRTDARTRSAEVVGLAADVTRRFVVRVVEAVCVWRRGHGGEPARSRASTHGVRCAGARARCPPGGDRARASRDARRDAPERRRAHRRGHHHRAPAGMYPRNPRSLESTRSCPSERRARGFQSAREVRRGARKKNSVAPSNAFARRERRPERHARQSLARVRGPFSNSASRAVSIATSRVCFEFSNQNSDSTRDPQNDPRLGGVGRDPVRAHHGHRRGERRAWSVRPKVRRALESPERDSSRASNPVID